MDDAAVIKELGYEANTKYISVSYRSGFTVSLLVLLRLFVRSFFNSRSQSYDAYWAQPGETLAFSSFKNEHNAIEEYIRNCDVRLRHIQLDLTRGTGLNVYAIIAGGMLRLPSFLVHLVRHYGFGALRRFAYPFLGYALFRHLRRKFRSADRKGTVITTNLVHPVSLAVHYAARAAGWRTVYLEHAMTPKLIAKDRGYTKMLLRSSHTKQMLAKTGIDPNSMEVLEYWIQHVTPAPLGATAIQRLGIAINDLDEFADIEYLAKAASRNSIRCELRINDADSRIRAFHTLGANVGAAVFSAAESDIVDFIKRQDVVIVGNSSVLLDCLRASACGLLPAPEMRKCTTITVLSNTCVIQRPRVARVAQTSKFLVIGAEYECGVWAAHS